VYSCSPIMAAWLSKPDSPPVVDPSRGSLAPAAASRAASPARRSRRWASRSSATTRVAARALAWAIGFWSVSQAWAPELDELTRSACPTSVCLANQPRLRRARGSQRVVEVTPGTRTHPRESCCAAATAEHHALRNLRSPGPAQPHAPQQPVSVRLEALIVVRVAAGGCNGLEPADATACFRRSGTSRAYPGGTQTRVCGADRAYA